MEPLDLPKNPYTVKVYSCPSSMFDFKTALSILFAIRFNNSKCDTPQLRDLKPPSLLKAKFADRRGNPVCSKIPFYQTLQTPLSSHAVLYSP